MRGFELEIKKVKNPEPLAILLFSLAFAWAPHALVLPVGLTVFLVLAVLTRFILEINGISALPKWPLTLLTLLGAWWALTTFRPFFGGPGSLVLLTLMTTLKLFEMHKRRDSIVLVTLGFVLISTRFLYAQTPLTALWMLFLVGSFTYSLVIYGDMSGAKRRRPNLLLALKLLLQALPLALLLFIIFPRLCSPQITLPAGKAASTGLSETLSPSSFLARPCVGTPCFSLACGAYRFFDSGRSYSLYS
jgi:hypothetical protein